MNKSQRVYAFIDSQNVNVSTQKFGWKMDWRKFRRFLKDKYGVTQAYMFIGYVPEYEDMYEFLHDAGYSIVLKPTVDMTRPRTAGSAGLDAPQGDDEQRTETYKEGTPKEQSQSATPRSAKSVNGVGGNAGEQVDAARKPVKGNVDAELVLWAMKELKNYDKAIIISGDGDFYCLVEYLEKEGKLLKLMPPNVHYSSLFKPYEKHIEHLGHYKRELSYRDRRTSRRHQQKDKEER